MARTKLGDIVAKAFRMVRGARAAGMPVFEYYERIAEAERARALGRRDMLLGVSTLALAACGSSLGGAPTNGRDGGAMDGGAGDAFEAAGDSPMSDASQPMSGVVGIVGAGLAGVHCAYLLQQAGVTASLYEAQNRIGGRMFSDRATFATPDAQHCELGGELIDAGHTTMRSLCQMLGIGLRDFQTDTPGLNQIVIHVGGKTLTMADILAGVVPVCDQVDKAVNSLTDGGNTAPSYRNPNGGGPIDALSITQWFDSFGFSGATRTILELIYATEMGLDPDRQSAWNFIWDFAPSGGAACDPFNDPAYDERYTTETGNDAIPTRLAALLDPSQIHLGYQLVAVAVNPDGRITLTFSSSGSVSTAVFDHVVLALPFTLLRQVDLSKVTMPAVKSTCIQTLGYGTGAKLMTGFSSRPWRAPPLSSYGAATSDLPNLQYCWDTSRLQPGNSGILTSFFGGTPGVSVGQGTLQAQRDAVLLSLERVFPGAQQASNGNVSRMHWPTFKWSLGSYACYLVGQWTTLSGLEGERVGNIHFAGEHTAVAEGANGFMEGAAVSGARAASEILADLGVTKEDGGMMDGPLGTRALPADRARRVLA